MKEHDCCACVCGRACVYVHSIERVPNFFDYIKGGIELTATCAIDYTASNKNCDEDGSLHFLGGMCSGISCILMVGRRDWCACVRVACIASSVCACSLVAPGVQVLE